MTKAAKSYTVAYEHDDAGWWVASVRELPGCHTQGRTIASARERIREAIQVTLNLRKPYAGQLVDDVKLPQKLRKAIDSLKEKRERAARLAREASEESRAAITAAVDAGLSLRDAGELIGVTRQRAQKLASG